MNNYVISFFCKDDKNKDNININTIYVSANNMYHALDKGKVQVSQNQPKKIMVVTKIELESTPSQNMEGEGTEIIETELRSAGTHLFA